MRVGFYSAADDWRTNGSKITDPGKLQAVRETLDNTGPILVLHSHYRAATAPDFRVFLDYQAFEEWLNNECLAGDAVDIWDWDVVCRWDARLVEGKCPDEEGRVPRRAAY